MGIKTLIAQYHDFFYYFILKKELAGYASVLDVGCGNNSPLARISKNFYSEGIDIFPDNIKESKKKSIHDKYKIGNIKNISQYYKKRSFDIVICIDVIEHFKKDDAIKIMADMEKIAKKKVIILTPNGYFHQNVIENNPYQKHYSSWDRKDFESLGYIVKGLRGLKYLRGKLFNIKWKPWFFWGFITVISEIILYPFPALCFDLIAVKNVRQYK